MQLPRVTSVTLLRALLASWVAAYALVLENLGCSSGAVCYRQTDCPTDSSCHSGQCVRSITAGDAGVAGATSEGTGAGTAGGDGTAGSAATASSAGAATAGSAGGG